MGIRQKIDIIVPSYAGVYPNGEGSEETYVLGRREVVDDFRVDVLGGEFSCFVIVGGL